MFSLKFITYFAILLISFGLITARSVSNSTPVCSNICTLEYRPHCVTLQDDTQKQFPNRCTYEYESCKGFIGKSYM